MIVNRIGDLGLILAMFLIIYVYKTLDYATIFSLTYLRPDELIHILNDSTF